MQHALAQHNQTRARLELPPIVQGIGVHFGEAVVGDIGNKERLQRTAIGDAVNVAARLESLTKDHKTPVLISREVIDAAQSQASHIPLPAMRDLGRVALRGRSSNVEVWTFAERPPTIPPLPE